MTSPPSNALLTRLEAVLRAQHGAANILMSPILAYEIKRELQYFESAQTLAMMMMRADIIEECAKVAEALAARYPGRVTEDLTNNGRYFAARDEHVAEAGHAIAVSIRALADRTEVEIGG